MSTMYVNKIQELNVGNGITVPSSVHIPGHIIQAQMSDYTGSEFNTSSQSSVATPISVTITPKYATSKILIMCEANVRKNTTTAQDGLQMHLYRNGAKIRHRWQWVFEYNNQTSRNAWSHWSAHYPDTPNSTSALTYTLYVDTYAGGSFIIGDSGSGGQMTALEVAQ